MPNLKKAELIEGVVYMPADEAGIVRSRVFPGLWLHIPALLAGEMAVVLATLQAGLASTEHAAFAAMHTGLRPAT